MGRLTGHENNYDSDDGLECAPDCLPDCIPRTQRPLQPPPSPTQAGRDDGNATPGGGRKGSKHLEVMFGVHAVWAATTGLITLLFPKVFEFFMNIGEPGLQDQAKTIIRLYGCLILAQSWLVWQTRKVQDPFVRKIFAQGYMLAFGLSTLVLGYKCIFTTEWGASSWPIIGGFFTFACVYAWFLITKKLPEYEPFGALTV